MQKILIPLILLGIAIAAAGCSGLPFNSVSSSSDQRTYADSSAGNSAGFTLSEKSAVSYPEGAPVTAVPTTSAQGTGVDTKIIKTAQVTLEVSDVSATADALKDLAQRNGGYLSSSNVQRGSTNRLSATVILRIPSASFENILASVKSSGTIKSVSVQGEDITEEYVDLQAQKTSYQNQLAQYNIIMKKAEKVEDVITVQAQIDRVQTELDRLEGRLRYLDSRIDLSTITVYLQEPEPVGGETGHSFVSAINEGIAGFFGMIDALIVLLFTLIPLIVIGCVVYWIYRWRKAEKKTSPAPPSKEEDGKA